MLLKRHVAVAASILLIGGTAAAFAEEAGSAAGGGASPRQVAPEQTAPTGMSPQGEAGTLSPSGSSGGEEIYGSQLMTQPERDAYLDRLKAAKDESERDHLRDIHRKAMEQRALDRGVKLPGSAPEDVTP